MDAVQECLERSEAGTPAPEAMALYPQLRDEFEPRLMAAPTVRVKRPLVPTAPRAALRVRLNTLDEADGHGYRCPARWRAEWRRTALLAAGALAALVLALGGLHAVLASSRPGDALYPLRVGIGRLRGAVLEDVEEVEPGLATREHASGVDAKPTPSPTATAAMRQPAARGAPTEPLETAPSARMTVQPGRSAPNKDIESMPGVSIPSSPAATVALTPDVGPAAAKDLGASLLITSPTLPTFVPATVSPAPTEWPHVSTGAIEGTVSWPDGDLVECTSGVVRPVRSAMPDRGGEDQLKATTDPGGCQRIQDASVGTQLVFVRVGHRIVWHPGRMDRNEADKAAVAPRQSATGVDVRMDQLDSGSHGRYNRAAPP